MLFLRDFEAFSGGHLKLADYIAHTAASGIARPVLWQTPQSRGRAGNIFGRIACERVDELRRFPAYFVAGMDWSLLDAAGIEPGNAPVINLVQGLRHADPAGPLHRYLARPALRICVSEAVAAAIAPVANGEVVVIENGVDVGAAGPPLAGAPVLIAGLKQPELAARLAGRLAGQARVDLLTRPLPRADYLASVVAARLLVAIPYPAEGFFLPPLEAMALGRGVVTMDCGGNRGYCHDGRNCLLAGWDVESLAGAVLRLAGDPALLANCVREGLATAARHTLAHEREAYHAVLARVLAA